MQRMLVPVRDTSLITRIQATKSAATKVLQDFCIRQIIDNKLSTKSFNRTFDFKTSNTRCKASVFSLTSLLYTDLKKSIPYIVHAERPMFEGSVLIDGAKLHLFSKQITVRFQGHNERTYDRVAHYHQWIFNDELKPLIRYGNVLTRRAISNDIPIWVRPHVDVESIVNSSVDIMGFVTARVNIRVSMLAVLAVNIQLAPVALTTTYLSKYTGTGFAMLSNTTNWSQPDTSTIGGEPLFTILPQIRKVLRTLTRKVKYDSFAFVVGTE